MKLICPDCGTQYDSGKFCQECGAKLQEVAPELVCPSCGYKAKSGKFCPECGTKLVEQAETTEDETPDAESPEHTFNERDPRFAKYYNKKGFPRTIPQEERAIAKEELMPYVDQNIAEAKMLLGFILLDEFKSNKEQNTFLKSESLFKEAEDGGDKIAYYIIGMFYLVKGNPENLDEAEKRLLECYKEYQDGDSAQSLAELYAYYEAKHDYQKAFEYATIAANDDEVSGYQVLGALYLYGWGVEKNLEKAVENYMQAAALGDEISMNQIGYIYLGQEGGEPNPEQAYYWFNEASKKGDAAGMYNLGSCYRDGFGVEEDAEQAAEWFKKSADLGNVSAMKDLAEYYQEVLVDEKKTKIWYLKAAESGDAEAQNKIGVIYANEGNDSEAIKWYQKAMEQKNAWATRNYAICLFNGYGCNVNTARAIDMMQEAISLGLSQAEEDLEIMLKNISDEKEIEKQKKLEETTISTNELHIPEGTKTLNVLQAPENSEKGWKKKILFLFLPNSIKRIKQSILKELPNLSHIVIPDGQLDKFGRMLPADWWRMYYRDGGHTCPGLTIPPGKTWVYNYGTTEIISGAQGDLTGNVLIPPTCVSIQDEAFMNNKEIVSVIMTDSVQFVGKKAFSKCRLLQNVHWSKNAKTLREETFSSCKNLQNLTIPEGVTSIEKGAFYDCKSLETISLPSTIEQIDKGGFWGVNPFQSCPNLRQIIVPKGVISKFRQLLNGFSEHPDQHLVEAELQKVSAPTAKGTNKEVSTTDKNINDGNSINLPMDDIRKAAEASYAKEWQKNIALAVFKIAEVIQERLPEAYVSYMVHPSEYDAMMSEYAIPIHFLFKKNGKPKVAVVAVTENGYRTFSVMKTQTWCEGHGIKFIRVYADGSFADWITGWSKLTNSPVTPKSVEFCKNWLVEKISKHL